MRPRWRQGTSLDGATPPISSSSTAKVKVCTGLETIHELTPQPISQTRELKHWNWYWSRNT